VTLGPSVSGTLSTCADPEDVVDISLPTPNDDGEDGDIVTVVVDITVIDDDGNEVT